ncbi:MAG: radical SAM protein [Patescibacteria group bacterium]
MNTIVFQVTKKCDQACPHCFFDSLPSGKGELSLLQIKNALDNLKSARIRKVSKFIFTGGEPTIWEPLREAINLTKKYYPLSKIRIDTNGLNFFKDEKLFSELKVDLYDLSIDNFHNQGIVSKKNIYKDVYVDNSGRSKLVDLFLKNLNKHQFNLYIRWTSNRQDEKLFCKFYNLYKRKKLVIEKKLVTATGRAKTLPFDNLNEGYSIKEKPENFQCLMGDSLILTVDGYWHACYHPVALTKLCKTGSKKFSEKLKKISGCYLYRNLPKRGLLKTLEYLKNENPKLIKKIDKVLAEKYWYRCEPCEKLCSMKVFKK